MNIKAFKKTVEVRTQTRIHFDDVAIEELVAEEVRAKHAEVFNSSQNRTVDVEFNITSGGILTGATATITQYERKEE